jgi:DNA (cytosine-5)-methyltransferase 1
MKFGSVCSGIEAASVAWEPLGWKAAWFSEIEPFPCEVLKHHYPDVPNLGDMTTLPERILSGEVEAPDLFCGGTPCQAFSVAGLRKSLGDARGNLSLTFCEIANAIDDTRLVRGLPASIVFWENVPGVLSTTDNAFGCFLAALVGGDEPLNAPDGWPNAGCVDGPQRSAAWRVLDAQYFGVAQRRRRVFVVASAKDGFDPAAVLFEFDGVRRDSAPSRETRQAVATTVGTGAAISDYDVAGTLDKGVPGRGIGHNGNYDSQVVPIINAAISSGHGYWVDAADRAATLRAQDSITKADTLLTQPIALQDVTTREKAQNGKGWNDDGTAYTVDTHATQGVAQPIGIFQDSEFGVAQYDSAGTLRAGRIPEHQMVMQPISFHPTQDPISSTDGTTHAMGCGSSGGTATVAVAQPLNIYGGNKRQDRPEGGFYVRMDEDTSKTLDAASGLNPTCSQGGTAVMQPMAYNIAPGKGKLKDDIHVTDANISKTIDASGSNPSMHQGGAAIVQTMAVRRLTPVECERLQGFPDGYTNVPWRKKPATECPDGPRYKALGNSWAVPVVRWIGKRIETEIKCKPKK